MICPHCYTDLVGRPYKPGDVASCDDCGEQFFVPDPNYKPNSPTLQVSAQKSGAVASQKWIPISVGLLILCAIGGLFVFASLPRELASGLVAAGMVLAIIAASFAVYFLPGIVAVGNGHRNAPAICVLNLFLGWTFLGWVVALVWAFTE